MLIGDYAKAKQKLGWEPKTSFKDLVKMMVESDIKVVETSKTSSVITQRMKVFFTGTKGFLGSHLVSTLKDLVPGIFIHELDGKIESYDSIESGFKTQNWDVIIHFAGLSHVADCENDPQKAFEVNTLGLNQFGLPVKTFSYTSHISSVMRDTV